MPGKSVEERLKRIFIFVLPLFILAVSCASPARRQVWNAYGLKQGETIIVGKVVIDPPLTGKDRKLRTMGSDNVSENTVWLICGDRMRKPAINDLAPDSDEFKGKIDALQGETFYYSSPAPFYIIAGSFYRNIYRFAGDSSHTEYDAVLLPGGFYADIRPGDRAIYIGTVKYHIDSVFNVTRVEIIDEYDREMPMFRRMFGTIKLRKALIKQPRPAN